MGSYVRNDVGDVCDIICYICTFTAKRSSPSLRRQPADKQYRVGPGRDRDYIVPGHADNGSKTDPQWPEGLREP